MQYGFICAGGGEWYSKTLNLLNVGDRVWLTIPGMGGLESIVVWRENFHYGSAFVSPLHTAVFDHILKQFGKPKAD